MAVELVLAGEAVVAIVLARQHWAWVSKLLGAGAMLDCIVAYEIGPAFASEWTKLLHAVVSGIACFEEMASFVPDVIAVTFGEVFAAWKPARHAVVRPIFDGTHEETCGAGTFPAWPISQTITNGRAYKGLWKFLVHSWSWHCHTVVKIILIESSSGADTARKRGEWMTMTFVVRICKRASGVKKVWW